MKNWIMAKSAAAKIALALAAAGLVAGTVFVKRRDR